MTLQERDKDFIISMVIKAVALIISVYGISTTDIGIMALTQYTNLSNVFADAMLFVSMLFDILIYIGKVNTKPQAVYLIKYMSTVTITVTFFIYLCVIAPTSSKGFWGAYMNHNGGSICVHMFLPVLAVADFYLFDHKLDIKKRHCAYCAIPSFVYLIIIVILGQCGLRWDGMMAPYPFLNYGAPTGWFGIDLSTFDPSSTIGIGVAYMSVALFITIIGLAALMLFLLDLRKKSCAKKSAVENTVASEEK